MELPRSKFALTEDQQATLVHHLYMAAQVYHTAAADCLPKDGSVPDAATASLSSQLTMQRDEAREMAERIERAAEVVIGEEELE